MQLCLGTVQFGMNYGICGQKKPSLEEACDMLEYAVNNGVLRIDTAKQYGVAEDVVGYFLKNRSVNRNDIFLSTKLQPNILDGVEPHNYYLTIKKEIIEQLKRLNTEYVDAYLLHSARYVYNDEMLEALQRVKKEGYARMVGVSVYETDEAKTGIKSELVDYLQMPYSIFDQRMQNEGVFQEAIEVNNTIMDTRSAFVQGLILMNEDEVPPFLVKAKPIIRKLEEMSCKYEISRITLALNYVKKTAGINNLVFGVDNIEQLKENICCFESDIDDEIMNDVAKEFRNIEADIVMPSLWKR